MPKFFTTARTRITASLAATGRFAKRHKVIAGIVLVVVFVGGYKAYSAYAAKTTTTQYALAATDNQSIAVTVSGSGQVESGHELSLSPKASGVLTSVSVKAGDTVRAGQVIATIDSTDALRTLRDARSNLQSARIAYQTSVSNANTTTSNSQTSLTTARDNGFDATVKLETDLPNVMQQLKTIVHDNYDAQEDVDLISRYDPQITSTKATMDASYQAALDSYNETFSLYQQASKSSTPDQILTLLENVYETGTKVNQATKDALAFYQEVDRTLTVHNSMTKPASVASDITALTTATNTITSDTQSVLSAKTNLTQAQSTLAQNTQSLSGSSATLSIETAQLNLQKAEDSYNDASADLADYSVAAPFAGTIGSVSLQKFDTAGGATAIATLITDQQFVSLSLNESDIANIQVGQPVSLTFDALEGVTATGTVAEVNQVGTVSQNVASYTVKVGFSSSDTRIKPGMTAEAVITTASKDNVLAIPVSALKTRTVNGQTSYYVQITSTGAGTPNRTSTSSYGTGGANFTRPTASSTNANDYPRREGKGSTTGATRRNAMNQQTAAVGDVSLQDIPVTIGIQNDTYVEITSGLTAGENVVTGTLNASGQSTATKSSGGLFGLFGSRSSRTSTSGTSRTTTGTTRTGNSGFGANAGGGAGGPPGGF